MNRDIRAVVLLTEQCPRWRYGLDTRGLPGVWRTFADYGQASIILYYFQSIDCIKTSGLGRQGPLEGGNWYPSRHFRP